MRDLGSIALVMLGASCNPTQSRSTDSAPPRLELASTRVQLGPMVQDQPIRHRLTVANSGNRPLKIESVTSSRFCTGKARATEIAPGGSTQLVIECRSDLHGPLRERLTIFSNDPRAKQKALELVSTVEPLLAFSPQTIHLETNHGEQKVAEIRLVGTQADRASITVERGTASGISFVEELPQGGGSPRRFRLTCTGERVGSHSQSLLITTNLQRPRTLALSYSCRVTGTLEVSPTNPYFNLRQSGKKAQVLEVRSSQRDFVVHSVRVTEGPFEATLVPRGDGDVFRVEVKVLHERLDDQARSATGRLLILSNDRTEGRRLVPLFGFGHVNQIPIPSAPSLQHNRNSGR